jgi:hypothetical protein
MPVIGSGGTVRDEFATARQTNAAVQRRIRRGRDVYARDMRATGARPSGVRGMLASLTTLCIVLATRLLDTPISRIISIMATAVFLTDLAWLRAVSSQ